MPNLPLEDAYEATLTQDLAASGSSLDVYVSSVPNLTVPAGYYLCATLAPKKGTTKQENVLIESVDPVNKKLTIKSGGRAQARYYGDSYTAKAHTVGTKIIITDNYQVWTELDGKINKAGGTFTGDIDFTAGTIKMRVPHGTTAQKEAIASPVNGLLYYDDTLGELQVYDGGIWSAVGLASVPNASTTVAGIVEEATVAEVGAGTGAGSTGARLFINPTAVVKTSGGAGDENKLAALDSSGKFALGFIPAISEAVTAERLIVSLPAGEAVDGSTTPQAVYVSDGSNGRTTGRFYKADANDTTNMAVRAIGFVNVNASSVGTNYNVIIKGVVPGFTGLTRGVEYYLDSTTAGGITATANNAALPIGIAVSATQLMLYDQPKTIYATYNFTTTGATVDTTINLGFRPLYVQCQFQNFGATASTGFWHIGMGTGTGKGFCFAGSTSGTPAPPGEPFLGVYSIDGGTTKTTLTVFSTAANTITIRRIEGHSGPALEVYLMIYG